MRELRISGFFRSYHTALSAELSTSSSTKALSFFLTVVLSLFFVPCVSPVAFGQAQLAGAREYALGHSSFSYLTSAGALYVNPAGLARLHENEILFSTARFRTLSSMTGAIFVPEVGTFAVGSVPEILSTTVALGYGGMVGDFNALGMSVAVTEKRLQGWQFGFGGSAHFLGDTRRSGVDAGGSASFGAFPAVLRIGAGWWLMEGLMRVQYGLTSRIMRGGTMGMEVLASDAVGVQVGLAGMKDVVAGLSYTASNIGVQLGTGKDGIAFSMSIRFGDAAQSRRSEFASRGYDAFTDNMYGEAHQWFRQALNYDEYDADSRSMARTSLERLDSSVVNLLATAKKSEEKRDFPAAMRAYSTLMRLNPERHETSAEMSAAEERLATYVQQLIQAGDSLRQRRDMTRARRNYELALELDQSNAAASARLDELEDLSKENVKAIITRGRGFLDRDQTDEAEREFQRALAIEPKNAQARAGLTAVAAKRSGRVLERGKAAFDDGKYMDALEIFAAIVAKEERQQEARQYLDQTREKLRPEVEAYFKSGLQLYVKEDYIGALAMWDRVLLIDPRHGATLEYKKRAEEKVKALERLK